MGSDVRIISKCNIWGVDILILVTLGTNDKTFIRLIKEVEKLIENGVITEKVVVQAGYTKYQTEKMEIFDLVSIEKMNELMADCSVLITHGGVGSIISGLKNNKKVIAVPRLEKYKEHVNDHQLQIVRNFDTAGYILGISDVEGLEDGLKKLDNFKPKKYESNTLNMISLVRESIER